MTRSKERELKPEEQMAQIQVVKALKSLGQPWTKLDLEPPGFSVNEVKRQAKLPSNKLIFDIAAKYNSASEYNPDARESLILEDIQGNRLNGNINEIAKDLGSYKRAVRLSQYSSRAPGGGPVVKKRIIEKNLEGNIIKLGKDKLRVRTSPIPDNLNQIIRSQIKTKQEERALQRFGVTMSPQDQKASAKIDPATETKARALSLPTSKFISLRQSANNAYDIFVAKGPFYGKDVKCPPNFRISAEPVRLPNSYRDLLQTLGKDIFALARVLPLLPDQYRKLLGNDLDYRIPFTFRTDAIISTNNQLKINEVQIFDGADALMMAEQIAYGLIPLNESTAFYIAKALARMIPNFTRPIVVGWLRDTFQCLNAANSSSNTKRMTEFISDITNGQIIFRLLEKSDLDNLNWEQLDGVINYSYLTPGRLYQLGLPPDKLLCAGDTTAIGNKGIYALLYDESLKEFFINQLGSDMFARLKENFIVSKFINSLDEVELAKQSNQVVKVYNAEDLTILDRNRGVFGPWSNNREWARAKLYFEKGFSLITQEFIEPARLTALLRSKGGQDLQRVSWYNRICTKYVADATRDDVVMTAVEATLGSNIKPAGKDCCFTAVAFDSIIRT